MPETLPAADDQHPAQAPALWEDALEEARSLIGVDLRRTHQTWNTEAAPDSVRHFCWALGDENPLFCDPAYGPTTRWQSGLAPGCFLYTIDTTVVAPKLRGIQWMYGGTDWEWYRPIRHRDSFTVKARLIDAIETEELRGATPRFWEDVAVDSWVQPMLKGPLNITDMVCWYAGGGHSYQAHRRAHMQRKRRPADAYINPETGAQDSAARGHTEGKMAREVGMPGGYDVGPQRISWLGQLMTNWS